MDIIGYSIGKRDFRRKKVIGITKCWTCRFRCCIWR